MPLVYALSRASPRLDSPGVRSEVGLYRSGGLGSAHVIGGMAWFELAAFLAEAGKVDDTDPLQRELQSSGKDAAAVFHAAAKVDG